MNELFIFAGGIAFGAAIILGLWIRDNEKPWRPPDELSLRAWMIATRTCEEPTGSRAAEAIREALKWWMSWCEALTGREDDT